jgi:hypothetical protein
VALIRAGARFERGILVERDDHTNTGAATNESGTRAA